MSFSFLINIKRIFRMSSINYRLKRVYKPVSDQIVDSVEGTRADMR